MRLHESRSQSGRNGHAGNYHNNTSPAGGRPRTQPGGGGSVPGTGRSVGARSPAAVQYGVGRRPPGPRRDCQAGRSGRALDRGPGVDIGSTLCTTSSRPTRSTPPTAATSPRSGKPGYVGARTMGVPEGAGELAGIFAKLAAEGFEIREPSWAITSTGQCRWPNEEH